MQASLVAQLVKNPPAMQETPIESLGWEDALERGTATHFSILTQRIPWTIQSMGSKESDTTEQLSLLFMVFPGGSVSKSLPAMWETRVQSQLRKIPQRRKQQPTPVFLPGEFYGQRSLVGYSPWDHKESDMTGGRTLSISGTLWFYVMHLSL